MGCKNIKFSNPVVFVAQCGAAGLARRCRCRRRRCAASVSSLASSSCSSPSYSSWRLHSKFAVSSTTAFRTIGNSSTLCLRKSVLQSRGSGSAILEKTAGIDCGSSNDVRKRCVTVSRGSSLCSYGRFGMLHRAEDTSQIHRIDSRASLK